MYIAIHLCIECKAELTNRERCESDGVCPYCGRVTTGPVCETKKSSKELPEEERVGGKVGTQ